MSKWKHKLTDINPENRTALCAHCGPVKIKKSGNGWRCWTAVKQYRKEHGHRVKYHGKKNPGKCDICGNDVRVAYDHNHKTGEFRGWLCINCNTILGLAHDNPDLLQKLIEYLGK